MNAISRFWYRHNVERDLKALFYLPNGGGVPSGAKPVVKQYITIGLVRGWSHQATATIVAAVLAANVVRTEFDLGRRERCAEQIRDRSPATLIDELKWGQALQQGAAQDPNIDPFVFRFNLINAILANWLVKQKVIDAYTKSAFVTCVAQALTSVDSQTINETLDGLTENMGSLPRIT